MTKPATVDAPFDDADLVALLRADIDAERRLELDAGLNRAEFLLRYAEYLPNP